MIINYPVRSQTLDWYNFILRKSWANLVLYTITSKHDYVPNDPGSFRLGVEFHYEPEG